MNQVWSRHVAQCVQLPFLTATSYITVHVQVAATLLPANVSREDRTLWTKGYMTPMSVEKLDGILFS